MIYLALMISDFDFIYITNSPHIGNFITSCGVRWVMVDLEYKGKSERQRERNTVISSHSIADVKGMRSRLSNNNLLVRINPMDQYSRQEIDTVIDAGADAIMLPFFKNEAEVADFVEMIASRCKIFLLFETLKSIENMNDILSIGGIDYVHVGLNDLHIERNTKFMFEFMADGSINPIADILALRKMKFGIGGVGRYGNLLPPAECILTEHVRLGSSGVILSRTFMDSSMIKSMDSFCWQFKMELEKLRTHLNKVSLNSEAELEQNRRRFRSQVSQVVATMKND